MYIVYLLLDVIGPGTGRILATIAGLVSLSAIFIGRQAFSRARQGNASARSRSVVAFVMALTGTAYSIIHLVLTTGGFGTGKGRAGAIIALLLGVAGMVMGWRAMKRAQRMGSAS